jgi:hypothetical protein
LIYRQLITRVTISDIDARAHRIWNRVCPRKGKIFGKSIYPKMYPMIFPTPVSRLAQALADSC